MIAGRDETPTSADTWGLGAIVVIRPRKNSPSEVVDGQQRLTTFFLLLCALKHLFQGEPQRQMISGLISTSYVDSYGEVRTSLPALSYSSRVPTGSAAVRVMTENEPLTLLLRS